MHSLWQNGRKAEYAEARIPDKTAKAALIGDPVSSIFGYQKGNNGGMAEYVSYPKNAVISRVREEMPLQKALLIEPYGCSKHAVDRAQIHNEDVVAKVLEMTDGYGCDIYIEASGHPASVIQGLNMVRKEGRFVEFSVFGQPTTVDWSIIGDRKELDILGSHLSPYCYPFVIENIANGKLKTDGVVSHTFPIEQWEEAFEYATGRYGDFKLAITF